MTEGVYKGIRYKVSNPMYFDSSVHTIINTAYRFSSLESMKRFIDKNKWIANAQAGKYREAGK